MIEMNIQTEEVQGICGGARGIHALSLSTTLPEPRVFTHLDTLWTLCLRDVHRGFFVSTGSSLTQVLGPFSFPEDGSRGWKFQASNHGLIFLVTGPRPWVASLEQKMLPSLRNFWGV